MSMHRSTSDYSCLAGGVSKYEMNVFPDGKSHFMGCEVQYEYWGILNV